MVSSHTLYARLVLSSLMDRYQGSGEEKMLILRRNRYHYDIKSLEFNDKQRSIVNRIPQESTSASFSLSRTPSFKTKVSNSNAISRSI